MDIKDHMEPLNPQQLEARLFDLLQSKGELLNRAARVFGHDYMDLRRAFGEVALDPDPEVSGNSVLIFLNLKAVAKSFRDTTGGPTPVTIEVGEQVSKSYFELTCAVGELFSRVGTGLLREKQPDYFKDVETVRLGFSSEDGFNKDVRKRLTLSTFIIDRIDDGDGKPYSAHTDVDSFFSVEFGRMIEKKRIKTVFRRFIWDDNYEMQGIERVRDSVRIDEEIEIPIGDELAESIVSSAEAAIAELNGLDDVDFKMSLIEIMTS